MGSKFFKCLLFPALIFLLFSCGKSPEEKVADGIESANILLSTRQCQGAIDLLESLGRQNKNAYYLKALSSAYACRAGYSTTVFFASDIALTTSPSPLGGMTRYSTSQASVTSPLASDENFQDLQTAIDILNYAGGIASTTEPSASERAKYFTHNQAGDINSQLAFMMLVQMGKILKVYSDASAAGVKGGGSASNVCFTDYSSTPALVQAYVTNAGSPTGACHVTNSSHAELAVGVTGRRARLCQGVVLMNSIIDILPSVLATAGGGDLDDLGTMTDAIDDQKDALVLADPTIGTTLTVMSQSNCESDSNITLATLASYYAVIFEAMVN